MHAKNIAVLHPSSELYGADRILVEALSHLPNETKKIVYLRDSGPLENYLKQRVVNVEVVYCKYLPIIARNEFGLKGLLIFTRNIFKFLFFIRREHRNRDFQLFYLNTLATAMMLIPLSFFKVKKIVHVHEIIDSPVWLNKLLSRITNGLSDLVICVSHAVKNSLSGHTSDSEKVVVLHNGIPAMRVIKNRKNSPHLKFYLFGRIMPKKGQWLLIDALKNIPRDLLGDHHFVIVGGALSGHEYLLDELHSKIQEAGLSKWVSVQPFVEDIALLMNDASVCLVPSIMKDPFPTTVLEAMSAGKPVIASNTGGAVEAIIDGETGLLFNPKKIPEFKGLIELVLKNPNILHDMGKQAKQRFEDHFSASVFGENWKNLMRKYAA